MDILKPNYYDHFHCIAGACPDSCCKGWAVEVDADSAAMYLNLPGELGDKLRRHLTLEDGELILSLEADGRCPMWREDGLCRIHAQLGENALCETCRDFPRLRHDYGSFQELGLELSCPEAACLLLERQDWGSTVTQASGGDEPGYDPEVMAILQRTRGELLNFLQTTPLPAGEALAVMLLYSHGVQNEIDGGAPAAFTPEDLSRAKQLALPGDKAAVLTFFAQLDILDPAWLRRLEAPRGSAWEQRHLAMACYFVERHWLQAVSDFDLISRAKLAVIACVTVKILGGDLLEAAQRFSKEIENDPDNLDALLDAAYTEPAFTDRTLLGLLLQA